MTFRTHSSLRASFHAAIWGALIDYLERVRVRKLSFMIGFMLEGDQHNPGGYCEITCSRCRCCTPLADLFV
jgi:hypothetical protein